MMDDFKPSHLSNLNEEHTSHYGAAHVSHSPRTSSSSSLHLTSTPKQQLTFSNSSLRLGHSGSSGSLQISDTEEEETNNNIQSSNDRINSLSRQKRSGTSKFSSRSLPVTPRVNGSIPNMVGGLSSANAASPIPALGGISTPLLMAPHLASHFASDGSYHSIGSLSPANSQYVTCSSGFMSESQDKVLPGSIDYSSLPLPKDESFRVSHKRSISRHLSEPSIHQTGSGPRHSTIPGKCHSCPLRKTSLKGRKRDFSQGRRDSDTLEGIMEGNPMTTSLNGIEQKLDELENMGVQWKFIQTLVDELNNCRAQNNRMAVELHQAKLEIQMLRSTIESFSDTGIQPGMLSEMVGQIHAAQKFRDEAMMSRIKLANEERDAAITHSRSLLDKLGLSPRAESDPSESLHLRDQRTAESSPNFSSLEEELKAIRLALTIQGTVEEKLEKENGQGPSPHQIPLDELKAKLCHSEASRWQLQEKCNKMEGIIDMLRRKVNGFSNLESVNYNPSSLMLMEMTLFGGPDAPKTQSSLNNPGSNSESYANKSSSNYSSSKKSPGAADIKRSPRHTSSSSTSDGDQKENTLSSLESVETASVSSWKKGCINPLSESAFQQDSEALSQPTSESVFILTSSPPLDSRQHSTPCSEDSKVRETKEDPSSSLANSVGDHFAKNEPKDHAKNANTKEEDSSILRSVKSNHNQINKEINHNQLTYRNDSNDDVISSQESKYHIFGMNSANHRNQTFSNHNRKQDYINDIITIKGPITEL